MNNKPIKISKKLIKSCAAALVCTCLALGCVQEQVQSSPYPLSNATPPPTTSSETVPYEGNLYFFTDGFTLLPEAIQIPVPTDMTRAQAALIALMEGPKTSALKPVITNWLPLSLDKVILSGEVCLVFFNGAPTKETKEQDVLLARAAIASTMEAAEGCLYTDVYINNEQTVYQGRPLGVIRPVAQGINVLNLQYPPSPSETAPNERVIEDPDAILYVTDEEGKLLCCDVRTLQYDLNSSISDILALLIGSLSETPELQTGARPALPLHVQYESSTFVRESVRKQERTGTGEGAQNVSIPSEEATTFTAIPEPGWLTVYLKGEEAVFEDALSYAALVNTITGFIPRLLGVRFFYNGNPVQKTSIINNPGFPRNDYMARSDFPNIIGHTITLYYPDKNGLGLVPVPFLAAQSAITDPMYMLSALLENTTNAGLPLTGLAASDILSVSINKDLAVVNCKPGFIEKLAALTDKLPLNKPAALRLSVYSIVNTLCGIRGVERVQFLQDGQRITQSLGGEDSLDKIFLGNPLFFNPGLLLDS